MPDKFEFTTTTFAHLGTRKVEINARLTSRVESAQANVLLTFRGQGTLASEVHLVMNLEQARELRQKLAASIESGLRSEVSLDEAVQRG